ncbi:ComF family protein [Psychromonas sp. 14N.309.X.WAT.B.A12]|uniref:ComF family protein n=1 Tax=unclassified Psychromonas TaxID=2614957 RepID=UPI0025B1ADCD|nr:phosphoribosyltransferase family protein [Psychromonas sp. 14N.309.X.WAT.B.A12]MDN2664554.1 phosphoribosyltransferase family protein [Psychromonas sp. 14N.309.X.WAT.B.A12]
MLYFLTRLISESQALFSACLPSHCLMCGLHSADQLICQHCNQAILTERPCCLHCGYGLAQTQNVCGECLKHPFKFNRLVAVSGYQAPFPALIKKLKYQHQLIYGDLLGLLLANIVKQSYSEDQQKQIDYILPVPLHPKKHRIRGFNQAHLIADALLKQLPLRAKLVTPIDRNKATTAQEGLTRKQRNLNLSNAFSMAVPTLNLQGKHVVLIDDVVTTGATINSICECLLSAGVKKVDVWCISRTELGDQAN